MNFKFENAATSKRNQKDWETRKVQCRKDDDTSESEISSEEELDPEVIETSSQDLITVQIKRYSTKAKSQARN